MFFESGQCWCFPDIGRKFIPDSERTFTKFKSLTTGCLVHTWLMGHLSGLCIRRKFWPLAIHQPSIRVTLFLSHCLQPVCHSTISRFAMHFRARIYKPSPSTERPAKSERVIGWKEVIRCLAVEMTSFRRSSKLYSFGRISYFAQVYAPLGHAV